MYPFNNGLVFGTTLLIGLVLITRPASSLETDIYALKITQTTSADPMASTICSKGKLCNIHFGNSAKDNPPASEIRGQSVFEAGTLSLSFFYLNHPLFVLAVPNAQKRVKTLDLQFNDSGVAKTTFYLCLRESSSIDTRYGTSRLGESLVDLGRNNCGGALKIKASLLKN